MGVSAVRKLKRCERLGRASQGEVMLNGENYQLIKCKVKIKDYSTTDQIKLADTVMKGSLNHEEPCIAEPAGRLQNLQVQTACKESSPSPPDKIKLRHIILHEQEDSKGVPSSPLPPCKLQQIELHEQGGSQQNLHAQKDEMQPQSLQNYVLHDDHVYSKGSSKELPLPPQPLKLQERSNEGEEEIDWMPRSSPHLQQTVIKQREGSPPTSPRKLQREVREVQDKAGGGVWEGVKKMECECCGMEEECTGGYEEKVRAGLKGHWLCGLCEEAVGEERKRVGGNVQAALAAHMQPCRRFSRRARSKASPSPSDVAVPHAVCRLLCRHLSTPSPRSHSSPSSSASLSRSSSCLPSLHD